jgi:hypothetical protein
MLASGTCAARTAASTQSRSSGGTGIVNARERSLEASEMLFEPKHVSVPRLHRLEDAVGQRESAIAR